MHRTFLKQALDVLIDRDTPMPMVEAAAAALITAAEFGIGLPGSALVLWHRAIEPRSPPWSRQVATAISELPVEPTIVAEALQIAVTSSTAEDARMTAVRVLSTPSYSQHVSPAVLLDITDAAPGGELGWHVARLVEAVHSHGGGLTPECLRMIRDRWSTSRNIDHRVQGVEIARLMNAPDVEWARRAITDAEHEVRQMFARRAPKLAGAQEICPLLEERLVVEQHRRVRSALHLAIAEITLECSAEERRVRDECDLE
jgi:hypothetical protein